MCQRLIAYAGSKILLLVDVGWVEVRNPTSL